MRAASAIAVCLSISSQALGQVELPELPYEQAALEPYISNETVSFHYGKHHQGYVNNLNGFIEDDPSLEGLDLSEIMLQTEGTIFNNAAQIYNHNLYWNSLSPTGGGTPTGDLNTSIAEAFGGYEEFRTAFTGLASGHFGSGWAWLMMHEDGSVDVIDSHDASNPVAEGLGFPLLVCDVWEHAYYLDYQNLRSDYIEGWWALVNWEYAETEYARVLEEGTSFSNDDIDGAAEGEDTEAESLSAAASSMFGKGGCFLSAVSFAAAGLFAMLLGL